MFTVQRQRPGRLTLSFPAPGHTGVSATDNEGPRSSRHNDAAITEARALVLASNGLLLLWGLWDGWRITHLVWPFLVEGLIVAVIAMRHIMRGTISGISYRVNGGPPTRARWPRIVMGLRAFNFAFLGLFVLMLFAIFLAVFQPIALPSRDDLTHLLKVLGAIAIVLMLFQRHFLRYRRKVAIEREGVMDLTDVVQGYRQVLVAWVGIGLLVLFAVVVVMDFGETIGELVGEVWRPVVGAALLIAAIAGKTWYEWWFESPDRRQ